MILSLEINKTMIVRDYNNKICNNTLGFIQIGVLNNKTTSQMQITTQINPTVKHRMALLILAGRHSTSAIIKSKNNKRNYR